jgi:hypothetical protein
MPHPLFTIIVGLLSLAVSRASDDPDATPGLGTGRFGASGEVRGTLEASPSKPASPSTHGRSIRKMGIAA